MNRVTLTTQQHGFKEGDIISLTTHDNRWWRRLWCWLTWQPSPRRTIYRKITSVSESTIEIREK